MRRLLVSSGRRAKPAGQVSHPPEQLPPAHRVFAGRRGGSALGGDGHKFLEIEIMFQVVECFVVDLPGSMEANEFGAPGRNSGEDNIIMGSDIPGAFLVASGEFR
jgi:hypothetical protein